jgi:hypothetical protein
MVKGTESLKMVKGRVEAKSGERLSALRIKGRDQR